VSHHRARQRPGTAKGFVFLSVEDDTGIANAIISPDVFASNRVTIVSTISSHRKQAAASGQRYFGES
jgi:hypothetical protein